MNPRSLPRARLRPFHAFAAVALVSGLACGAPDHDVVLYCALDQVHSEPLIKRFEEETGLRVRAEFDVEANKTVGLVQRIRAESAHPRCDVFWNNEIANTVALADEGLLESYSSPSAADIPAQFVDPEHRWTGFAARARVFIVNTDLVKDWKSFDANAYRMWDLLDPKWAGKVGMARPLTGTTLTHMAALFSVLGEDEALRYLTDIREANRAGRLELTSGNAQVMRQVRDGQLAWGWTDSDDYNVAREAGAPVAIVYPDQFSGKIFALHYLTEDGSIDPRTFEPGIGTLFIPNTVAIVKGAPHLDAARRLVDFILSPAVEEALAFSPSAQIPVRDSVPRPEHVIGIDRFYTVMDVDFTAVGRELPKRHELFKEMFLD